jgi:predicted component of type VI protein secretion system
MFEETQTQAIFAKPALLLDGVRHEMGVGLFRVGRDPQNHLVLEDSSLSRTHFVIDVYGHQAQLIDVGSANGTYVNKKRVHSAWLKDGDRIRLGDHVLVFRAPGFVTAQEILDEVEQTYHPHVPKPVRTSIIPMLALLVASASLFIQLVNRDRQMEQDQEIKRQWAQIMAQPKEVEPVVKPIPEKPEIKWQKALVDFRSGSEDEACESIKALIPELHPSDLLKAKAKSFFERKCVL